MLAAADRPLPAEVLEGGTLLRPPASGRAVQAVARRLGLPSSYAGFLAWIESRITRRWVARADAAVSSTLREVGEQLAVVERWLAEPEYHWFAVRQVRRLAAAPVEDGRVAAALDRFWAGNDAYLMG